MKYISVNELLDKKVPISRLKNCKFKATIKWEGDIQGVILHKYNQIYLCQNRLSGNDGVLHKDYKYSWRSLYSKSAISENDIMNLKIKVEMRNKLYTYFV